MTKRIHDEHTIRILNEDRIHIVSCWVSPARAPLSSLRMLLVCSSWGFLALMWTVKTITLKYYSTEVFFATLLYLVLYRRPCFPYSCPGPCCWTQFGFHWQWRTVGSCLCLHSCVIVSGVSAPWIFICFMEYVSFYFKTLIDKQSVCTLLPCASHRVLSE